MQRRPEPEPEPEPRVRSVRVRNGGGAAPPPGGPGPVPGRTPGTPGRLSSRTSSRQRPASKMKQLQQQLKHHEELTESLQLSPVRTRVPAERDGASEDHRFTRRWQWLKAAEVGVRTHLAMIWEQEQQDPGPEAGRLLDHPNEDGDTALHRCAALGHVECVEWLLERGASTSVRNHAGEIPADVADSDRVEDIFLAHETPAPEPSRRRSATPPPPLVPEIGNEQLSLLSSRAENIFAAVDASMLGFITVEQVQQHAPPDFVRRLHRAHAQTGGQMDKPGWTRSVVQAWTEDMAGCGAALNELEASLMRYRSQPSRQSSRARPLQPQPQQRTVSVEPTLMGSAWESGSEHGSRAPSDAPSRSYAVGTPSALAPLQLDSTPARPESPGEEEKPDVWNQDDNICERSCFLFSRKGFVRRSARSMLEYRGPICCKCQFTDREKPRVSSCAEISYFEGCSVLLIALNSLFLAMYDPLNPDSEANKHLEQAGNVFTVAFTVEMIIKMVANGVVFGDGSYMKDGFWNMLDLIVVGTGWLDLLGVENNLGVLRTVRLLRPLRTIGAIKGLRHQVEVLMQRKTLENIANVCLLMLITFSVFSIVGVRLFAGAMRGHCYDETTLEVQDEEAICQEENDVCEEGFFCSTTDPLTGEINPNPAFGILGFDDFGTAMMTVFICTTLEGWTDVMYMVQDGFSDYAWPYFVLLIISGSIIIINLFLAVISGGYELSMSEEIETARFKKNAVECIEMLKSTVHAAIIQPTEVKCRVGQKVQLNEAAISRLESRNRDQVYNLNQDNVGTVKAARDGGRVRVQTEDGKLFWHDTANLVPLGLGPASPTDFATQVDDEGDRVAWAEAMEKAEKIDMRISRFLRLFNIVDYQKDREMTFEEFHQGLMAFNKSVGQIGRIGEEREEEDQVYISDEGARSLLSLLADPDPKGRDKKWQQEMLRMIFVSFDVDDDGALTQAEFYDCFVHPELAGEDDMEEHLTYSDLNADKLRGKKWWTVVELWCQFLSHDPHFNHFITTVVFINCTVLAVDYYEMPVNCTDALISACMLNGINFFCTLTFLAEMIVKLVGLTFRGYISDSFNIFDGTIVLLSIAEMALPGDGGGISVFRALRILRIFKAAARFENLKKVIMTIINTIPELANFFILLSLVVFFYAVMGLQMFGGTYGDCIPAGEEGDNGIEPDLCVDNDGEHPRVNFDSFWWALMTIFQTLTGEDWNAAMFDAIHTNGAGAAVFFISLTVIGGYVMLNLFLAVLLLKTADAFEKPTDMRKEVLQRANPNSIKSKVITEKVSEYDRLDGKSFFCMSKHSNFRQSLRDMVRNRSFDNGILACIMISSLALALEEPNASPDLLNILDWMDYGFTIVFLIEMSLKIAVLNFYFGAANAYIRDPWNMLDFAVVCASVLSRALPGDGVSWVRGLRVLRALRPLRVIQRVPELKLVVNSLFKAIPIIVNVLVLLAMFWLIFGILGVQLFKGQFYSCSDGDIELRQACSGTFIDEEGGLAEVEWSKPGQGEGKDWGFDNIVEAVITLFEVSTLERWLDIMNMCIDAVGQGVAPRELHSPMMGLFFMTFIMFGSFFMLELFVSAIVAAYTMMNEESDGTAFQSERQKRLVSKMVLGSREEEWSPKYEWQEPLFKLVSSPLFENLIILFIILNTISMALFFDGMDPVVEKELDFWNSVFTLLFLCEAIIKMAALSPWRYFTGPASGWNNFDFVVVLVTTTELVFTAMTDEGSVIPGATVLRVFRIARIFRLLAKFKGLTNLFLAIVQALPTIMNVGTVLFLVYYIYAVLAMNLFGRVKRGEFLSERANFEKFGVSLLTIFRMSTGESWNGIMEDCRVEPPDCTPGKDGDCGSNSFAPLFFISFQVFGQYVMLNLFVAVMLEFYQRQQHATEQHLNNRDRKDFEETWAGFVGRDYKKPYRRHQLMPAELFDQFMYALPERIGWSKEERAEGPEAQALKRQAYESIDLPTRAMKVLVPWSYGKDWTRPGNATIEWQEAQDAAAEALAEARMMQPDIGLSPRPGNPAGKAQDGEPPPDEDEMAPLREREKEIRAAMADAEQLCREKQAEKRESGALGSSKAGSPANRQLEDDLAAQKAVWKYLRKRAKTAGIPQQNVETFGGDEGGNQDGLVALLVATERRTELWSERVADDQLTPAEMDQLFALNQAGDADDLLTPLQLQKLKPNRARELLMSRGIWSRVSVIEHHYYHFDEVWHAVYNRAERRHLNDPENLDFKDDQSKERQVNLFKSIMESTAREIDKSIKEGGAAMDTGVTQAMIDGEEPLTPRHIYSAMRVQKMIVEKRRNAKFAALKDLAALKSAAAQTSPAPTPAPTPAANGVRRRRP